MFSIEIDFSEISFSKVKGFWVRNVNFQQKSRVGEAALRSTTFFSIFCVFYKAKNDARCHKHFPRDRNSST